MERQNLQSVSSLLVEKDELSLLLETEHIYFKTIVISHSTSRVRLTYG